MTEVTITVRPNGPYKVNGPITVVDVEGREFELPEGTSVVLCRCGHFATTNKSGPVEVPVSDLLVRSFIFSNFLFK